jgi:hypothetical protein
VSTLEIHGARVGDRAVGKPRSSRMQPTGPELGAQVRAALWDFYGSTRTQGDARDRLGVAMVRNRFPATRELFSDAALTAVLREPGPGRCSWDHYRELARERGEPPLVPSPELFGLLGRQCGGCRTHFAAQAVAERERPYVAALVAAGFKPEASGSLRSAKQVAAAKVSLDSLTNAKLPPRATGVIWPASKTPAPSYYRPGRPR